MTDREKAGLRGPVKLCVEEKERISPRWKSSKTTEYGPHGRHLTTRITNSNGLEWVITKTYDVDGRVVKTASGNSGEPAAETLYTYDEAGRLQEIRDADEKGNLTSYRYHQQARKTEIKTVGLGVIEGYRKAAMVAGSSLWDVPQIDMGLSSVGSIAILYDERDLPIELQILDSKERVVSRCIRTYDVNGRIMEENYIPENPASGRSSGELDDKQFETMNEASKMVFSGRRGTGKSFTYDSQGRVTEVRDRNWAADTVTTTGYNEHGDKSEERMTTTNNLALPIDGVSEMPPVQVARGNQ